MSFWELSDGTSATEVGGSFETPTGGFEVIPSGTRVLASIDKIEWKQTRDNDAEFVEITWVILDPEDYKNRRIFQKLFIVDLDPKLTDEGKAKKKRDNHLRMLAAIDANAGGKLASLRDVPENDDFLSLKDKIMMIDLEVWEKEENGKSVPGGNWVRSVSPRVTSRSSAKKDGAPSRTTRARSVAQEIDDEIPF